MTNEHEVSRSITQLVLGLDAYYRQERAGGKDKLDAEGLAPVHWSTEGQTDIDSWDHALVELQQCLDAASTLPDPWARDWLSEYVLSLRTLVRWFSGEDLPYERVVAGAVRVDPRPPTASEIIELQQARDRALAEGGCAGFAAYQEKDGVAGSDVASVMEQLMAEARERTLARLPMLRVPSNPISVTVVQGTAFTAYCDYPGRTVWINTDIPHTRSGLKQLVGHEAYPGHYVHMGHRDALVREGRMLPDAALVVTNTASSVLFEGIAERGLDFLDWRQGPDDAVAWLQNRLQWLCSIEVAHALNTRRSTPNEAATFLQQYCDADEAWIDGKLRFVTHRLRAPFVYTYWWGGTVVGQWWSTVKAGQLEEAMKYLYNKMHSPSTLIAHWSRGGHHDIR